MVRLRWTLQGPRTPQAWSVRAKVMIGATLSRVLRREVLVVTPRERHAPAPKWQRGLMHFATKTTFPFAIGLLLVCGSLTAVWGVLAKQSFNDLWSEMGGMTLDVLFVLIIYETFVRLGARRETIERQHEIIDDYKRWDAQEGRFRIAGALRRLNRLGVTAVDFAGIRLSDFDFAKHGISSLAGSSFYDGGWGEPLQESKISLTRVDFSHIDCTSVRFSPFDPFEALEGVGDSFKMPRSATLTDCEFIDTSLAGAVFNGAEMSWSTRSPSSHFVDTEEVIDGELRPSSLRETYGAFYGANLRGAQFRACRFHNADFRDASHLRDADFFRATGLETARFDNDEDRDFVLANAARPE